MALGDAAQPQAVRSHRVVLDAYAFIKGWLIATTLWVGVLLLLVAAGYEVPALPDGADGGHVWGLLGIVILYGFGVSLVFAAPMAWVLAYLLRPVRNQWIHIGAIFAVPTLFNPAAPRVITSVSRNPRDSRRCGYEPQRPCFPASLQMEPVTRSPTARSRDRRIVVGRFLRP